MEYLNETILGRICTQFLPQIVPKSVSGGYIFCVLMHILDSTW